MRSPRSLHEAATAKTARWVLRSAEGNRATARVFRGNVVTRQPSEVLASLKRLRQKEA
ncbi:MAG TPA: hypothetical protein VHI31_04555 [Actinomycetota bacterium]|nr:hypothetical protein [Actinomycetota bacterium]